MKKAPKQTSKKANQNPERAAEPKAEKKVNKTLEICVVLPDIRSSHNIGSIFRTSDAAGVSRIVIAGYSPCPTDKFNRPQKEIAKTALGAEKTIPWEYVADPKKALSKLKAEGFALIAVEQDKRSISYKEFFDEKFRTAKKNKKSDISTSLNKIAIVFGNEVDGLSTKLINMCEHVVDIPMKGEKESLNVSVSAGIVLYGLIEFVD